MSTDFQDRASSVRVGEEIDVGRLVVYLAAQGIELGGPLEVAQFPSGYSNLTYLVRAGDQEWVLRRPPFGSEGGSAHDMGREYRTLAALAPVYSRVPQPVVYCTDESVIGTPFYLMERVHGVILRVQPPSGLDLSPSMMRRVGEAMIDNLVVIHALPYRELGLVEGVKGYVERQIEGWTRRYARARTDDIPEIDRVAAWLAAHVPPQAGSALIHNDYKYDNLVLDPADLAVIRAVLDWEMSTVGDPLMDLGSTLGYWVEATDPPEVQATRFGVTTLPGNLTRAELVARYSARSGRDVSNVIFYYVYGMFKLIGIGQQIYARYTHGYSQDKRFAGLIHAIRALGRTAVQAIETDRLGGSA